MGRKRSSDSRVGREEKKNKKKGGAIILEFSPREKWETQVGQLLYLDMHVCQCICSNTNACFFFFLAYERQQQISQRDSLLKRDEDEVSDLPWSMSIVRVL